MSNSCKKSVCGTKKLLFIEATLFGVKTEIFLEELSSLLASFYCSFYIYDKEMGLKQAVFDILVQFGSERSSVFVLISLPL